MLSEVGEEGQQRLLGSRVLVAGAGGLGSPAALYLAAGGVGTLGIADFDTVGLSNLQRQVLHHSDGLGRPKVESAAEAIGRLNSDVTVKTHPEGLAADNVLEIMSGYEVVVDGSDNYRTRYLMNDAALNLHKPMVHGSVYRFEGRVTVFLPYEGPCYRCLFPEPPPAGSVPPSSQIGLLGAVPGVVGSIEALEAIKLLLGIGEPLIGRMLAYDGLSATFSMFEVLRRPECAACGDPDLVPEITDYDEGCSPPELVPRD